jgi:hypothetical protein
MAVCNVRVDDASGITSKSRNAWQRVGTMITLAQIDNNVSARRVRYEDLLA